MVFDFEAQFPQRNGGRVLDKENGVRVADVDADRVRQHPGGNIQMQRIGLFGQRDRLPIQIDRAHIDGEIAVIGGFGAKQPGPGFDQDLVVAGDRKSTRLNSSHVVISYAVFCFKKKNTT